MKSKHKKSHRTRRQKRSGVSALGDNAKYYSWMTADDCGHKTQPMMGN